MDGRQAAEEVHFCEREDGECGDIISLRPSPCVEGDLRTDPHFSTI
jgi:hypothetical protein